MKKGLISRLNKEEIEPMVNPGYSISDVSGCSEYFASVNPSEFKYSYNVGASYKIKQPKNLWGKIKDFSKVLTFITALGLSVFGLSGCPSPYVTPDEPTTEATAKPTATPGTTSGPTDEPTPTPEPDKVDISGNLEDVKYHEDKEGTIVVYDTKNPDGSYSDCLGTFSTDSSGHFSFTLEDKLVNPSDKIYVRAVSGSSVSPTSYARTIELDAVDNDPITAPAGNPAVRVKQYKDFNKNGVVEEWEKEVFKEHAYDINSTFSKWDWDYFWGIRIFTENGSEGEMTQEKIDLATYKITDPDDIEEHAGGKNLDGYIQVIEGAPPQFWEDHYIYVVPDHTPGNNGSYTGCTYTKRAGRTIIGARIEMDPDCITEINPTLSHEFAHAFNAPDGHATHMPADYTIMWSGVGGLSKSGIGDKEFGEYVYEETYQHTDPYGMDDVIKYTLGELDGVDKELMKASSGNPAVRVNSYSNFCTQEEFNQ